MSTFTTQQIPDTPRMSIRRVRALLVECWPNCFAPEGMPKRPLASSVSRFLLEKLAYKGHHVHGTDLSRALADYCTGPSYLREITCGAHRYDLEGRVRGGVTQWDQDDAERKLNKMGLSIHKLSVEAITTARVAA